MELQLLEHLVIYSVNHMYTQHYIIIKVKSLFAETSGYCMHARLIN